MEAPTIQYCYSTESVSGRLEKMGEQKVSQAKVPVVWNFAGK